MTRAVSEVAATPVVAAPTGDQRLMADWRRRYRRAEWRRVGWLRGTLRLLARPLTAARDALRIVRRPIAREVAAAGPSRPAQFARMWWLRVTLGVEPFAYHRYRLYEPDRWARRHAVVRDRELTRLQGVLTAADPVQGRAVLADKERTPGWAAEHGIATVAPLLVVDATGVIAGAATAIPDADLFSKLTRNFGGTGARRWRRTGADRWQLMEDGRGDVGAPVDRPGLLDALRAQAVETGQPVAVQRFLTNHPALAGFTNGALATLRFVTLRSADGTVRPSSAAYRMPRGAAVIDAFMHGGLVAAVDLRTGTLGPAMTMHDAQRGATTDRHPDTGTTVAGTVLPGWDEVVALVLRAHRAVPGGAVPLVGWDVALTPDGPIIVEGNVPPSAMLQQVPFGRFLGETAVLPRLMECLRALR